MLKRTAKYFWSVREQFIKYFVVGISGLFLDIFLLAFFTRVLGQNPTLSLIFTQLVVLVYNFSLNKYWSFANRELPHRQIVRYLVLAGFNYIFSLIVMYVFNESLGFDEILVRIATIALMVSWNFFLYKYWVYKIKKY